VLLQRKLKSNSVVASVNASVSSHIKIGSLTMKMVYLIILRRAISRYFIEIRLKYFIVRSKVLSLMGILTSSKYALLIKMVTCTPLLG
jgi:hypothetical protein